MTTPERRQSGWWGSISGGLFGSAAKRRSEPEAKADITRLNAPARSLGPANISHADTPRPRVSFQDERPESPESPPMRASAAQMAARKILDRPQGPSSKLSASTVRATNFSAVASPRPMFRASSSAAENGRFQFTPRAGTPAKPLNNAFRATTTAASTATPSRDMRGSTAESISRGMNRVAPSELFAMKIPEPPANLTGEELTRRIPQNPNRVGSIYADEYLADLCPKDFNETQRKQFFCILDLRRLKYASDEIYVKKDWRFNILNFAKEYEKSRSLIMLRYGLYEFKSIKPSQEVVSKWKASHGIPLDEEDDTTTPSTALARPNGTEGILSRGKRKAAEEPAKAADKNASSQNKRARGVEREPLTETATPTLNKGSKKRMADAEDQENPPSKQQKSGPTQSKAPSATKKFFEQVANSKPSSSPSISVEPPSASKPKSAPFSGTFGSSANGSATKSIFETAASKSGASQLGTKSNIFGHLSDTGSGAASGAENDAGDEDDSDDDVREVSQSDDQSAAASIGVSTPQPAASLFGAKKRQSGPFASSASSDAGDTQTGSSLFDRVTKGEDGKPKRMLSPPKTSAPEPSPVSKPAPSERPASPAKPSFGNQTWSVDSPIKFAAAPSPTSSSLFGSTAQTAKEPATASAAPNLFNFSAKPASKDTTSSTPVIGSLGASSTGSGLFGTPANATVSDANKEPKSTEAAPSEKPAASQKAPHPMFGSVPGEESKTSFAVAGQADAKSVFGASKPLFGADPSAAATSSKPLFGAAAPADPAPAKPLFGQTTATASTPTSTEPPKPLFGASQAKDNSKPLFGVGAQQETPKPLFGQEASKETPKPAFSFGASQETPKPMFGQAASSETPKPSFAFGTTATQELPKPLFGQDAAKDAAKPMFSFGASTETPKPLFGQETSKPTFSFGATSQPQATTSLFGAPAGQGASATPSFGASKRSAESEDTEEPQAKRSIFGSTAAATGQDSAPKSLFGGSAATTSTTPTFSFGAGANNNKTDAAKPPTTTLFGANSGTTTPAPFSFGNDGTTNGSSTSFSFGSGATQNGTPAATPSLIFGGASQNTDQSTNQNSTLFGGSISAPSSFTFGAGGGDKSFNNPFSSGGGDTNGSVSFNFGGPPSQPAAAGGASSGMFSFGSGTSTQPNGGSAASMFSFGGSQTNGNSGATNGTASGSIFNLAPPMGGTSTGTNTPFTLGGASSLATTPAAGTPEPATGGDEDGPKADGDEEKQAQINLTEGGPGEEDEDVVFEVRAKALKLVTKSDGSDEEGDENKSAKKDEKKSPWKTMGVGPIRLLKHKTSGAVRILLRGDPRGNVIMNKLLLAEFEYKTEPGDKYVKVTTAKEGGGLETWMLQVKDKAKGKELAAAMMKHREANKRQK